MAHHINISSKNSENGTFLLNVPTNIFKVPSWLVAKTKHEGYKAKHEYHVTVIGLDLANMIREYGFEDRVRLLIDSFSWALEIEDKYIELAKDDDNNIHRQSIICMVEVSEFNLFFLKLEDLTGFVIDRPPTHITLFTKNYDRGIGLYSMNDLNKYKVKELSEKF
jgi:hypothetical protein